MSERTGISWCDSAWNFWSGCVAAVIQDERGSFVHPGCAHCYARDLPAPRRRGARWGCIEAFGTRPVAPESYWMDFGRWARKCQKANRMQTAFIGSACDVLEKPLPYKTDRARYRLWDALLGPDCTHVMPLFLTKRPENWREIPDGVRRMSWLGTSVSDQRTAGALVPRLLDATDFRGRFLSVEPLLGPLDLSPWLLGMCHGIDWIIVGGETGPDARPLWVPGLVHLASICTQAGVPLFVKQGSGRYPGRQYGVPDVLWGRQEFPWQHDDRGDDT